MSLDQLMQTNVAMVPTPDNGVEVTLGTKDTTIETGCLIHYNGYRVASRVALYKHEDDSLTLMSAQRFIVWAKRQPFSQKVIEEYIYSCSPVPSPPLTYSKIQLKIEQNQIVVFENKGDRTSRMRFGNLSEDMVSTKVKPQDFLDLFAEPTIYDWVYYRLRDAIDNTHVPNIADGRFNGLIDGKSVMGESTDPKWGKRSRLLTTPKVFSSLDSEILTLSVFHGEECEQNSLGDPALFYMNWEVDKLKWARFLQERGILGTQAEIQDLYFAINAGNLIGNVPHKLMTIDKKNKTTYWRRVHQGDKVVGMGPAIVDGVPQEAILKGTVLEWDVPTVDFIVADAYKGETPTIVNSRLNYSYTTEYMSKEIKESSVPLSVYTYVDHEETIAEVQSVLDGDQLGELIENMTFYDEDGEPHTKKSADALSISSLGMRIPSIWNSNGVDQHILSLIRKRMSPSELTLWKVLSFSIGKGLDNLYIPITEAWYARREIAKKVANQLETKPDELSALWGNMDIDYFTYYINNLDIQVVAITVPVFPGLHTSHTLRLWDSDTIGMNPRLALGLLRDSDGDLACCLFPKE